MDGVSRYSWFRSARSSGVLLVALILLFGVSGYVLTSTTIRHDRDEAAEQRAQVETVHAQEVLGRARAYVGGLAEVLAREPEPGQARFASWAGATSASVGLNDVLWVERVPASGRERYERVRGVPITRLTRSGRIAPAREARSYLPATYTSQTRPELHPGVDVSGFPGLGAAIRDRASIFAVGASKPGALGAEPGFYLLQAASFARGPGSGGYLVAFVPRGWFSTTLGGDPRRVAISEDGKTIEGSLDSVEASAGFEMLGRNWRIDVAREPPTGLQSTLPWLALAWPFAIAGIAVVIGRAITQRRRAQREVERIFEMSIDMICVGDFDGRFKAVNPAFERTLGYSTGELLARPFVDFVHPDDRQRSSEIFAAVLSGHEINGFENRYLCKDGSERWLQWSARAVPHERVVHAIARDVTESRRITGEQAALRRVATLVAQAVPLDEIFNAVTQEGGILLAGDYAGLARFDGDEVVTVAVWAASGSHPPVPPSWKMQEGDPATTIAERQESARWEDWTDVPGPIAEFIRELGIQSTVGCPIVVEGELWGALAVHSTRDVPLPADADRRINQFNDLVAMAIVNARARGEVARLAQEQAALRRVATLVARDAPQGEVFTAIADSIAELFGTDDISMTRFEAERTRLILASSGRFREPFPVGSRQPLTGDNAATRVFRTGKPVRIDDYATATGPIAETARSIGIHCVVATPIVVEGRPWGALTLATGGDETLPPETEARLGQFTELMATAIANTEAQARAERLAAEQAALRRVATLVAEGVEPAQLFAAVTREVARLFADVDPALVPSVIRFDQGPEFVLVGASKEELEREVGSRYGPTELFVSTRVLRTGASARVGAAELDELGGPDAELLRREGFLYQVGSPIIVEGLPWGAITINSANALPPDAGERLEKFTELVATAIANTESREALAQLVEEQAALRRVATLAAEGGSPSAVLDAVVGEMETLLDADQVALNRFEPGDEILVLAHRGLDVERTPVGSRVSTQGESVTATVRRTGRPARIEDYGSVKGAIAEIARETGLRSSVSAPITVEGQLWGLITASWKREALPPPDTEERMVKFAALLDTAIANAEARSEIERLAEEQAALRRVATLVAEGVAPTAVFDAVAAEMARLLEADGVTLSRYEPDEHVTVVAHRGANAARVPAGTRVRHTGENVTSIVRRTKRPARLEHYEGLQAPIADLARDLGVRASVAAPITVYGHLWGVTIANWQGEQTPPADTEERMTKFAGLLDTAIANADSRDQLAASRARLVTAADEARRRLVRDLHDGAQQRLVHTIVSLKLAQRAFGEGDGKAELLVGEALQHAERSNAELRELAHGILPAVLTRGGLRAGVDAVVSRVDVPVRVDVLPDRFPLEIEASAYFIVAEALTNVMKHSHATRAEVRAYVQDGMLYVEVHDDGIGGADPTGHGLVGMADRVTALGGRLTVESPPGDGSLVAATLPLSSS